MYNNNTNTPGKQYGSQKRFHLVSKKMNRCGTGVKETPYGKQM